MSTCQSRLRTAAVRDPVAEFMAYNRPFVARGAELVRLKVARMAASPFAFFRGTFHLFARDLFDRSMEPLPALSTTGADLDLVGDIHSENYGTFKAADGRVHYDVNDFDETTRGRFTFDVARLATSLFLAARERGLSVHESVPMLLEFLQAYAAAVQHLVKKGGPGPDAVEGTPSGSRAVDDLLGEMASQKRPAFIEKLTECDGKRRRLVRGKQYYNLPDDEAAQARRLVEDYRKRPGAPSGPDGYYAVEDVAGRVAGIGSMGRFRYAVLIAGKGTAEARNIVLEFKESLPSAYDTCRQRNPGPPKGRAERVVTVQRRSQAASSAFLGVATDGEVSFQAREISPHAERLDFKKLRGAGDVTEVAALQAKILARIHARAAADAVGPTNPLAELEDADLFCQRLLAFALAYADLAVRDYQQFVGHRAEIEDTASWAGA
jgi:uncharacterized protein (DUF2252 family)